MNGGMPRIAMFRFTPGGGGTRGKGRGGRRPMLRVLESAICLLFLLSFHPSLFGHFNQSAVLVQPSRLGR